MKKVRTKKSWSQNVIIGKGNLAGKGLYAARNIRQGEIVIPYHLEPLSQVEFEQLPTSEKMFTHAHWGQIYLYAVPERYVNHSFKGNVYQDLYQQCDIALRNIKKGEKITGDATKDDSKR